MQLKPYGKYKESGIELVNKIPSHWQENRLASIGAFSKGRGISRKDLKEEGIPAILYGDIYTKYEIQASEIVHFIDGETADGAVKIKKGDILFTGSGETLEDIGKSISYEGDETVYVGGDVIILSQQQPLFDSLFLSYSLSSSSSVFQKSTSSKGTIILHIYSSRLKNILLALPPPPEQTAIATYLDRQTALIDQKVALLSQKIDKYQELKKSLINETVCRGLDPSVTMKDSGVEWIGEVPAHWEVKRGKDLFIEESRKGYENLPLLAASQKLGVVLKEKLEQRSMEAQKSFEAFKLVEIGEFVISLRSFEGGIEIAYDRGIISPVYSVFRIRKDMGYNGYFKYLLKSSPFIKYLGRYITGIRDGQSIKFKELQTMMFPLFSETEQKEIANYLDEKTAKIESITANLAQQITTLKELRKTLINDVVTGKVKVPNYVY